jgi:hypothetical protein
MKMRISVAGENLGWFAESSEVRPKRNDGMAPPKLPLGSMKTHTHDGVLTLQDTS